MLNVEIIKNCINEKYSDIKNITDRIIRLSLDCDMSYVTIYRILKSKKSNLENLIKLQGVLKFSLDEVVICE